MFWQDLMRRECMRWEDIEHLAIEEAVVEPLVIRFSINGWLKPSLNH